MKEAKHPEELFLEAQKAMGAVKKDSENPHFKSHYASYPAVVAAIKGPLNDLGLTFRHTSRYMDSHYFVGSVIISKDGPVASFEMPLMTDTPQKMGSALTYAKRYTLEAVLGLPTEDDDGNASSQTSAQRNVNVHASAAPQRASAPQEAQGEKKSQAPRLHSGPSEPQLKRLFAITKANGVEKFDVDTYIKEKWGTNRAELSRAQYDDICELLNSGMFYQEWKAAPAEEFTPPEPQPASYADNDIPF